MAEPPAEASEGLDDTRDVRAAAGDAFDPESDVDRSLVREPPREAADPDRVADELGVRDPEGAGARGGSTRDSDPPPEEPEEVDDPEDPEDPEEPEEPDDPDDPELVGRGIACAAATAGAARAIVTAATINERGNLSISMHSLRTHNRQGGS